jgi:prepilin-type N-terminal cleavage/methylation domain-containing protein
MTDNKRRSGFTLIELAVVLFIIGLLLGGLMIPIATSVEQRNRAETEQRLQQIQEALYGFAVVNGRLPCPDCEASSGCTFDADDDDDDGSAAADDGLEDLDVGNGACEVSVGNMPWSTLNVTQYDDWGYSFTYKVTGTFSRATTSCAATGGSCTACNSASAFDLCAVGNMSISKTDGGAANVAQNVPAIVISHGKNHYESTQSAEEVENYERSPRQFGTTTSILSSYSGDTANAFVYKDYSQDSAGDVTFDDLMIWISPFTLKDKLISAGKLP